MPTVIKNQTAGHNASAFNLADIAIEARTIIDAARTRADKIVADAEAQVDAIRRQARDAGHGEGREAGFAEGRQAGRDEAAEKFDQQFARVGRALAESAERLNERAGALQAEARQDLVALALAVAEKIVRARIAADPDAARRSVDAAVELAGRASRLSIRVCPEDLDAIQAFAPQLADRLTGEGQVQVVADEQVESGGCLLTTWRETGQASEIDAQIQTQLDRISEELLGTKQN